MFIAIVDFNVAPENRAAALNVLLAERPLVQEMAGNRWFMPYLDPTSDTSIRIVHEWVDAASFESYTASEAFKNAGLTLHPLMTGVPISRRMTAQLLETVR